MMIFNLFTSEKLVAKYKRRMQLLYIIPFTLFVIQNLVDGKINQIDLRERDMNELALKKVMYSCKFITQCSFIPVIIKQ